MELGQNLVGVANSAADISDGLIVDLDNICRASGLGAVIRAMSVPKSDCVSRLISKSKKLDISTILVSGDDYELVFTASPDHTNKINALSDEIGVKITNIGNIVESQSVRVIDESGNDLVIGEKGYSHF